MLNPLFEAKGISKNYDTAQNLKLHVLEAIDLKLNPNEIVAIIGASGCGKSTLLRIVAGLIPASQGTIFYHGKECRGLMPGMSMVFQTFALYPWMTVQKNIEIVLQSKGGLSQTAIEKQTREAIELIGLSGFEEAYPREISGGMKQRVGMARALVKKPEMLFMDEPFSEVDAFTAEVLRDELIHIWSNKHFGLSSILFVSHDVGEVAYLADRIVVLGMNPATVRAEIENKIPRPRNYHSPEFLQLVEQLHDTYGRIKPPSAPRKPKPEKASPLLPINRDEILGLLRYLNVRGGSQDIFKIGAESRQHFDQVALVIDAAELLNFIEISHRTASITPQGKAFAAGNDAAQRQIWKEQLLTNPLFAKILNLLQKSPSQSLSREEVMALLRKEFPYQDEVEQFHILVRWGSFGGLFAYHKLPSCILIGR